MAAVRASSSDPTRASAASSSDPTGASALIDLKGKASSERPPLSLTARMAMMRAPSSESLVPRASPPIDLEKNAASERPLSLLARLAKMLAISPKSPVTRFSPTSATTSSTDPVTTPTEQLTTTSTPIRSSTDRLAAGPSGSCSPPIDASLSINLIDINNPDTIHSTTPYKNNLLHIAAMLGHCEFAQKVWSRDPSLFSGTNIDGETPLITALMAANPSLASDYITAAAQHMQHDDKEGRPFNRMLLMVDTRRENALHHAIRNGFESMALELLDREPRLSEQISNTFESPMYMAARRGHSRVVDRLLEIPSSANYGPENGSAMHAAVRFNHTGVVEQLLQRRLELASCQKKNGNTPLMAAVILNRLELVKMFLKYNPDLGYIPNEITKDTPFIVAARTGHVLIAKAIVSSCPDTVYTPNRDGYSALHVAIMCEQSDFIDYVLKTPQFHRLVNQVSNDGNLPLHLAARKCDPKLLRSLLSHAGHDYTAINSRGEDAVDVVYHRTDSWKTLKWNESFALLSNAIPFGVNQITEEAKIQMKNQAVEEVKSLTAKYTSNASLVAALLATITFAAAFTLPGGFSTDPSDAGQPLLARKVAFKVFLVSDTIAMCCSLAVAFLGILATWEDLDFLLNYRKSTRVLMWCAYEATALAFGTGLFTVIAPSNFWLALVIMVVCTILPLLSKIIGEWPLIIVRYRLRGLFRKDLLPKI